jgi:hypothetical protein
MTIHQQINPPIALQRLRQALEAESFAEFVDRTIIHLETAKMAAAAGDSHGRRRAVEMAIHCLLAVGRDEIAGAQQ